MKKKPLSYWAATHSIKIIPVFLMNNNSRSPPEPEGTWSFHHWLPIFPRAIVSPTNQLPIAYPLSIMRTDLKPATPEFPFIRTRDLPEQFGLAVDNFKRLKNAGRIQRGIHYQYGCHSECPLTWNRDLLRDLAANNWDEKSPSHLRAIERYLMSLPSHAA